MNLFKDGSQMPGYVQYRTPHCFWQESILLIISRLLKWFNVCLWRSSISFLFVLMMAPQQKAGTQQEGYNREEIQYRARVDFA
jgi:hypothetical protein